MLGRVLIILTFIFTFANDSLLDFNKVDKFKELYNQQKYKEALLLLQDLRKETPVVNYNIANTLYKLNRYNEAIYYYKIAHGEGVDEVARLFNIGNSFFKLKKYDDAIFVYKTILKYRDDKDTKENLKLTYLKKLEEVKKKKSKKSNKKQKEKSKKDNKQKSKKKKKLKKEKKLTKKELEALKKLEKKKKFKQELSKMLNRSLKDKKVPVLMYKIDGVNSNTKNELKPW